MFLVGQLSALTIGYEDLICKIPTRLRAIDRDDLPDGLVNLLPLQHWQQGPY